jgi:dihydroneopterin aldolase
MYTIIIESSCECIIGVLEHERQNPQKVLIFIKCRYDYEKNGIICYAELLRCVQHILKHEKFYYLENAVDTIIANLKKKYMYDHLRIRLDKPHILNHTIVGLEKEDIFF